MSARRYKKPQTLWLGRSEAHEYELGLRRKDWTGGEIGFADDSPIIYGPFCVEDFGRATGIRLEVGDCVKVRINVELL